MIRQWKAEVAGEFWDLLVGLVGMSDSQVSSTQETA